MSLILQWCELLKQADPAQLHHPYIHATAEQCMLDTSKEYAIHSKQNSIFKNHIKKLSLEKIINYSESIIHEAPYEQGVLDELFLGKVFTTNYTPEHFIAELQQEADDYSKKLQAPLQIFEILQRMCERARVKRVEAKTNGIWDTIKFYIWSWFYDQTSRLKKPEIRKAPAPEIVLQNLLNSASSTIQNRILINMSTFEEDINVHEKERNCLDETGRDKFKTPRDVKQKWVTKYAEDKYPQVSERAADARKRILILYNLWEKLIEKKKSLSDPEAELLTFTNDPLLLLPIEQNTSP
jgi:hypothetical protein